MISCHVLYEAGYPYALEGVRYNFNCNKSRMTEVTKVLAKKDRGHDKFLRMIVCWASITAPRFFWTEFDTYSVGVVRNSESTIHTLLKKPLSQENFCEEIPQSYIDHINYMIEQKKLRNAKGLLPESFMQTRMVMMSYAAIKNIIIQRKNHPLKEWQEFIDAMYLQLNHSELLPERT